MKPVVSATQKGETRQAGLASFKKQKTHRKIAMRLSGLNAPRTLCLVVSDKELHKGGLALAVAVRTTYAQIASSFQRSNPPSRQANGAQSIKEPDGPQGGIRKKWGKLRRYGSATLDCVLAGEEDETVEQVLVLWILELTFTSSIRFSLTACCIPLFKLKFPQ